ncbi:MAG: XisI protein [Roseiflexaceae bacterium]|nr:XisI protein [Roseiflexaceae bacterium]
MDTRTSYRHIIENILTDYASVPYAYSDIEQQTIFDRDGDHYLVMLVGRDGIRRVHGCLVHIDLVDGKAYIQRDGTEVGIATMLMRDGIPKEHIVLAFRSPELRRHTDFAVA